MTFRRTTVLALTTLVIASLAWAPDLFLKLDTYFLKPQSRVKIPVLNGTLTKSEGFVAAQLADISIVSPAGRTRVRGDSALSCSGVARFDWDSA